MDTRINVIIPEALFRRSQQLVDKGFFSNFSEIVREGLRNEVKEYEDKLPELSEEERKLFALLKEADEEGLLVGEKEMKKHGLKV